MIGVMSTTVVEVTVAERLEKPRTVNSVRSSVNVNIDKVHWEELLAAQLSPLASLHHRSFYSRIRFGPEGCSMTYVPLSIHMPERVKELQVLQAEQATQQAWWLSKCSCVSLDGSPNRPSSPRGNPVLSHTSSKDNLQEELLEAIQSPLALDPTTSPAIIPPPVLTSTHVWKTSDSHPINISMLIPPELLQIISTHITQTEGFRGTMFDVPPLHQLHFLLERARVEAKLNPSDDLQTSTNVRAITLATNQRSNSTRSDIVSALWKQTFSKRKSKTDVSFKGNHASDPTVSDKDKDKRSGFDIKPIRRRSSRSKRDTSVPVKMSEPITIGNMYMSSCPGKKVRLDGPVNGRSAVRRDLAQDLMRMWQAGVRCVVCCLDDSELEYLGAPWPEYCRIADEIGLDVLRLPTPEGLAPLDISLFDRHLTRLIKTYTLNGQHTLVHCRGGVGRAGLVACCWMLKLGLCGWNDDDSYAPEDREIEGSGLRRDTLLLVERALWIVRKRRSPKAVETYEQVKFLVDYVDFLRQDPGLAGSEDSAAVAEVAELSSNIIDSVLDLGDLTLLGKSGI